jgi:hypothetical protein
MLENTFGLGSLQELHSPQRVDILITDYPNKSVLARGIREMYQTETVEPGEDIPIAPFKEAVKAVVHKAVEIFSQEASSPQLDQKEQDMLAFLEGRGQYSRPKYDQEVFNAAKGKTE